MCNLPDKMLSVLPADENAQQISACDETSQKWVWGQAQRHE
jgi:hypothetical protein